MSNPVQAGEPQNEPAAAPSTTPSIDPARLRYDERPIDTSPVHTADLPATPTRDRNIAATAWVEAPAELLVLGDGLGHHEPQFATAMYKRRIGRWLLWRAGPATEADARYLAIDASDLTRQYGFRLYADGSGEGDGPSGHHTRFRSWKEDLRDAR